MQLISAPTKLGRLDPDTLVSLLASVAAGAMGASVCIFDPDLDPTGRFARLVADIGVAGLSDLGSGCSPTPTR